MDTKENNKQKKNTLSFTGSLFQAVLKDSNESGVETKISKIQQLIQKKRLDFRLNLKSLNFLILITSFPFCFGLFNAIFQKYNTPDLLKSFFERNLPTLTKTSETLDFLTLKFLFDSKLNTPATAFFPSLNETYRFYLHENFFLVNKNIFSRFFGQQHFTGNLISFSSPVELTIFRKNKKIHKIHSFLPQTKVSPRDNFYRDFDELPSYLENLFQPLEILNFEENFFSRDIFDFLEKNPFSPKPAVPLVITNPTEFWKKNQQYLPNVISCLKTNYVNGNYKSKLKNKLTLNSLQQVQNDYYQNSIFIQKEFKNIFLEKRLFPDSANLAKESPFLFDIESSDLLFLERLLSHIDNKFIVKDFLSFRKMSGYRYPDMGDLEISYLLRQNQYFSKNKDESLKIQFPSFTISTSPYDFYLEHFPSFLIATKHQKLADFEKPEISYEGPGLLFETQANEKLDWKMQLASNKISETSTVDSWLNLYFSFYNPIFPKTQEFSGLYKSRKSGQKTAFTQQDSWARFYEEFDFPSQNMHFSTLTMGYNVPYFNSKEWKKFYLDTKTKMPSPFLPVPALQTQVPKIKIHEDSESSPSLFGSTLIAERNFVDYVSPIFEIGRSGKVDYELSSFAFFNQMEGTLFKDFDSSLSSNLSGYQNQPLPFLEKIYSLNFNLPGLQRNESFPGGTGATQFRKTPSIFSKKSSFKVSRNWEFLPFKIESLSIISQISFAVLIFFFVRSIYTNYTSELLLYFLDLIATVGFIPSDIKEEFEILLGGRDTGYRIIPKSRKTFQDLVGITHLIPHIFEIVLFLRNSGRIPLFRENLPKGVLLVGPPGTGKTLLAQAIAGEAQVPLIVLSGSSLIRPGESSTLKLKLAFKEARRLSPCLIFIDEIDSFGQRRGGESTNSLADSQVLETIKLPIEQTPIDVELHDSLIFDAGDDKKPMKSYVQAQQIVATRASAKRNNARLLMQLLVELNGVIDRPGVVVVGATNRLDVLDRALLRPGRLNKVLPVGLPSHEKRIEIFKFYAKNFSSTSIISWDYLAARTYGFSAADIATIMNQSSLKAILTQTFTHTIQTIEHGIDRLTVMEIEKLKISNSDYSTSNFSQNIWSKTKSQAQVLLSQLAYYQAGKTLLSFLLEYHPNAVSTHLWPRKFTRRTLEIAENLRNYFFASANRFEVEHRLIGCYGGKAAEFLFFDIFPPKLETHSRPTVSTFGLEDLYFGYKLSVLLVQKWVYYSKQAILLSSLPLKDNFHESEFTHYPYIRLEKIEYFRGLVENLETMKPDILLYARQEQDEEDKKKAIKKGEWIDISYEEWFWIGWWFMEFPFFMRDFEEAEWFRVHLPNLERNFIFNRDWVYPDNFYNNNDTHMAVEVVYQEKRKAQEEVQAQEKAQSQQESQAQEEIQVQEEAQALQKVQSQQESQIEEQVPVQEEAKTPQDIQSEEQVQIQEDFQSKNEASAQEEVIDEREKFFTKYTSSSKWNDLPLVSREYQVQSLVLQSFNHAFVLLDQNREVVDCLAIELLSKEILRDYEISQIVSEFTIKVEPESIQDDSELDKVSHKTLSQGESELIQTPDKSTSEITSQKESGQTPEKPSSDITSEKQTKSPLKLLGPSYIKYVRPSWGYLSRRPLGCWVDLRKMNKTEDLKADETAV